MKPHHLRNLIFDLDGTLVDSSSGIIATMRSVLPELGIAVPSAERLQSFIGPPLEQVFPRLLPNGHPTSADEAVKIFRARYEREGMFQAEVYAGVFELLRLLQAKKLRLFVATNKHDHIAARFCEHHRLRPFFEEIVGIRPEEGVLEKSRLLNNLLSTKQLSRDECAMIGDRAGDLIAARENEIVPIAASWGWGSREELFAAEPLLLASNPAELGRELMPLIGE